MLTFRLYPEPRRTLFVRVRIHPTLKAMRERSMELTGSGIHEHGGPLRRVRGFCTEWRRWWVEPGGRSRKDPCIAEVNLARRYCTMEIVTHELFHATMAWGRRVAFPFTRFGAEDSVTDEEEQAAYVHGELCRAFVVRAEEAGLYS